MTSSIDKPLAFVTGVAQGIGLAVLAAGSRVDAMVCSIGGLNI